MATNPIEMRIRNYIEHIVQDFQPGSNCFLTQEQMGVVILSHVKNFCKHNGIIINDEQLQAIVSDEAKKLFAHI